MSKTALIFLALFLISLFSVRSVSAIFFPRPERKIIVFRREVPEKDWTTILSPYKISISKKLKLVNAVTVSLTPDEKKQLASNPRILRIDPDIQVYTLPRNNICERFPWLPWCPAPTPTPSPEPSPSPSPSFTPSPSPSPSPSPLPSLLPSPSPSPTPTPEPSPSPTPIPIPVNQPLPWNITRIQADKAWPTSQGNNIKVAVLDTGIDRDHPDLKNNLYACLNFIYRWRNCEDDNGHGSHVSGVIAAENNQFGTVGISPEAKIASLKVLNYQGAGYLSDVIEALDWAVANRMQIVNMSLGATVDVASFKEAVEKVDAAGIVQVAAAGNFGPADNSITYPARYPQVVAVAAIDSSDNVATWSSRGWELDLSAPGVNIYSTYKNGGYATLSGTSFSAPHVSGTVALRMFLKPGETPAQIRNILKTNTEVLTITDPTLVGSGLVNAFKVVNAL